MKGVVPFRLWCISPTGRYAYYAVGVSFRLQSTRTEIVITCVPVEVAIAQLQGGARPPSQSRATVDKNRKISYLIRRLAVTYVTGFAKRD